MHGVNSSVAEGNGLRVVAIYQIVQKYFTFAVSVLAKYWHCLRASNERTCSGLDNWLKASCNGDL